MNHFVSRTIVQFVFVFVTFKGFSLAAQQDTASSGLKIDTYLESYYQFDFSKPADHNRPTFIYSYNRHNEVNINIAFARAEYRKNKVRAAMGLMTGTYANANLAAEPGVLKNLYEAYAGVKISNKKRLWLDVGVFPSHIGFESAVGKDCWTLTRSISADNSPYYESGARISYTTESEKWFVCGLVLNGWQRIQRPNYTNAFCFGHHLVFKPNAKITLNSSSFIGSDAPDSIRLNRYFHDFFGIFQLTDKWGLTVGFDIAWQQKPNNRSKYKTIFTPTLILRYAFTEKCFLAVRSEYYHDPDGMFITTNTPNGFQTYGYSANIDYYISSNVIWRLEGRSFLSKDKIFMLSGQPQNQNYMVISSLAVSF